MAYKLQLAVLQGLGSLCQRLDLGKYIQTLASHRKIRRLDLYYCKHGGNKCIQSTLLGLTMWTMDEQWLITVTHTHTKLLSRCTNMQLFLKNMFID